MVYQKKAKYESIYQWLDSKKGTCFYCYEDKPVAIKLFVNGEGVCQDCLDRFEIGHFGTDRHVIEHLCDAKNHKQAVTWIKRHGGTLIDTGEISGDCHFYIGVNDIEAYNRFLKLRGEAMNNSPIPGSYAMSEEMAELSRQSYNSVEIYKDGRIHIIY